MLTALLPLEPAPLLSPTAALPFQTAKWAALVGTSILAAASVLQQLALTRFRSSAENENGNGTVITNLEAMSFILRDGILRPLVTYLLFSAHAQGTLPSPLDTLPILRCRRDSTAASPLSSRCMLQLYHAPLFAFSLLQPFLVSLPLHTGMQAIANTIFFDLVLTFLLGLNPLFHFPLLLALSAFGFIVYSLLAISFLSTRGPATPVFFASGSLQLLTRAWTAFLQRILFQISGSLDLGPVLLVLTIALYPCLWSACLGLGWLRLQWADVLGMIGVGAVTVWSATGSISAGSASGSGPQSSS